MQVSTVALDWSGQLHIASSIEDRCAVIAQQSIDEDRVSRLGLIDAEVYASADDTDAGSVNKQLVTGAAFDDFSIAGDDFYASLSSCLSHGPGHHTQRFDRKTFLAADRA